MPLHVHDRWNHKFDMERNKLKEKEKKKAITHLWGEIKGYD
ncbi:MAG: hypothetical protein ACR2F1_13385 [Nitrososphaeraceae archaeon]